VLGAKLLQFAPRLVQAANVSTAQAGQALIGKIPPKLLVQLCLAAVPDTSISGKRVARELTTLIERRGKPSVIVSDHGTEFTSNAILA
jgi:hypothetical protein